MNSNVEARYVPFKGYMTTPVRFVYETHKERIRFRSSDGELGNTSRINLKGRKYGVYATVDAADAYKKLSDDNPGKSVEQLVTLAKEIGNSELIQVAEYFLEKECRACIPIVELDKDML